MLIMLFFVSDDSFVAGIESLELFGISLRFVLRHPINNKTSFVLIMSWCRKGDKSLSKPMMADMSFTYICVTRAG